MMQTLRSFAQDLAELPRDLKLLAASAFLWGAGDSLFIYIVPLYMEQLGAGPAQIGVFYGLGAALLGAVTIPAGILADRWGRKQVLLVGWLTASLAVLVMALAPTLTWFGLGWGAYWLAGFVVPAMSSYVVGGRGSLTPERALTLTYAGFSLGTIISPSLGAWIGALAGLRSLFAIGAALAGLSTVVLFLIRAQPVAPAENRPGYAQLLRNRRFVGLCGLVAGMWFVMWLGFPLAPTFLADVRGHSAATVGVLGSFEALGALLLALVLGRQPARRGFLWAHALVMLSLGLLLQATWVGWLALAYFVRAAAFVARTLAEAQATRAVQRPQWGLAFGLLETVSSGGTMLAPLAAGWLYEARPAWPFQLSLLALPASMLLVLLVIPRSGVAPAAEADFDQQTRDLGATGTQSGRPAGPAAAENEAGDAG